MSFLQESLSSVHRLKKEQTDVGIRPEKMQLWQVRLHNYKDSQENDRLEIVNTHRIL